MNIERLELEAEEVRNRKLLREDGEGDDGKREGLDGENEELLEDFAFKIYQQQTGVSSEKYVSGVDRYFTWLELMAEHAKRNYPKYPLEADEGDVYDYFSWLSNTEWGINTKKSYFAAVQRFYKWVDQSGKGENITDSHSIDDFTLDPGALERERQRTASGDDRFWLPAEDVEKLWMPENLPSPRTMWELAFKLMWYTTARSKAICEIKIDNIDREEGMIVIPNLKPGDDEPAFREVLYPVERIEPLLTDWLDRRGRKSLGEHVRESEYLFPSLERPRKPDKEIRLRPSFLSKKVKEAAKNAGVNGVTGKDVRGQKQWKVTAHTIRHSAITYLANETDIPIHMVKKQAGHSKLDTTLSYIHDDEAAFKREFRQAWE
jgi:integrase/recombinase XerD